MWDANSSGGRIRIHVRLSSFAVVTPHTGVAQL